MGNVDKGGSEDSEEEEKSEGVLKDGFGRINPISGFNVAGSPELAWRYLLKTLVAIRKSFILAGPLRCGRRD